MQCIAALLRYNTMVRANKSTRRFRITKQIRRKWSAREKLVVILSEKQRAEPKQVIRKKRSIHYSYYDEMSYVIAYCSCSADWNSNDNQVTTL